MPTRPQSIAPTIPFTELRACRPSASHGRTPLRLRRRVVLRLRREGPWPLRADAQACGPRPTSFQPPRRWRGSGSTLRLLDGQDLDRACRRPVGERACSPQPLATARDGMGDSWIVRWQAASRADNSIHLRVAAVPPPGHVGPDPTTGLVHVAESTSSRLKCLLDLPYVASTGCCLASSDAAFSEIPRSFGVLDPPPPISPLLIFDVR